MDDTTLRIYFPKVCLKKLPTRIDLHYSLQKQITPRKATTAKDNYKTLNIQGQNLLLNIYLPDCRLMNKR